MTAAPVPVAPGARMDAAGLVGSLRLSPHPEGGWYRETFRDPARVTLADGTERAASTAILYLLEAGGFSAFHRVRSAEAWHLYRGGPVLLHVLGSGPIRLDPENPQAVVPALAWQAAEALEGAALCGCTVAPGFEFADLELGSAEGLVAQHPAAEAVIRRLCRR